MGLEHTPNKSKFTPGGNPWGEAQKILWHERKRPNRHKSPSIVAQSAPLASGTPIHATPVSLTERPFCCTVKRCTRKASRTWSSKTPPPANSSDRDKSNYGEFATINIKQAFFEMVDSRDEIDKLHKLCNLLFLQKHVV